MKSISIRSINGEIIHYDFYKFDKNDPVLLTLKVNSETLKQ